MKRLLVVVDMQYDFVSGTLGSHRARAIVPAVQRLVAEAEDVVYTQDTHERDYLSTHEGRRLPVEHCIRGTQGQKIVEEVYRSGAPVIEKGSFGSLALADYVKAGGYDEITLCGLCTDICVISNALILRAALPEAEIRVIKDACAGASVKGHGAALETMKNCHVTVI